MNGRTRLAPPERAIVGLIHLYQRFVSPLLGPRCRFHPSCSHYACAAVEGHGLWRGCSLALRRLLRCHPFHPGGLDPVPPPVERAVLGVGGVDGVGRSTTR